MYSTLSTEIPDIYSAVPAHPQRGKPSNPDFHCLGNPVASLSLTLSLSSLFLDDGCLCCHEMTRADNIEEACMSIPFLIDRPRLSSCQTAAETDHTRQRFACSCFCLLLWVEGRHATCCP